MIRDAADNPVSNFRDAIPMGGVHTYTLHIDCVAGQFLSCSTPSGMAIRARHATDSWVDLAAGATIDLATWDGLREPFSVEVTAPNPVTGIVRKIVPIDVR